MDEHQAARDQTPTYLENAAETSAAATPPWRISAHGPLQLPADEIENWLNDEVAGMLANGDGFFLVPPFVLVLGVTMPESTGTSLAVVAVPSVPTFVTHWVLGHIDSTDAAAFAGGGIPGAGAGSLLAQRSRAEAMNRGLGAVLIGFAVHFVARQIMKG